jgi:hypothetical protein
MTLALIVTHICIEQRSFHSCLVCLHKDQLRLFTVTNSVDHHERSIHRMVLEKNNATHTHTHRHTDRQTCLHITPTYIPLLSASFSICIDIRLKLSILRHIQFSIVVLHIFIIVYRCGIHC